MQWKKAWGEVLPREAPSITTKMSVKHVFNGAHKGSNLAKRALKAERGGAES